MPCRSHAIERLVLLDAGGGILLEGNPLADIEQVRRIAGVVATGRWYDRDARARILAEDWDLWHALRSAEAAKIARLEPLAKAG